MDRTEAPPEESKVTTDKEELVLRNLNRKGYFELLLFMETDQSVKIIVASKYTNLPRGDLEMSWYYL